MSVGNQKITTSKRRRLRMLLDVGGSIRRFYSFECKGDDIYWWPSSNIGSIQTVDFEGIKAVIDLDSAEKVEDLKQIKASYHASGQFHVKHVKTDDSFIYDSNYLWRLKSSINQPFRICALISKSLASYDVYEGKLSKGGSHAAVLKFQDEQSSLRKYFEFFISPEGSFPIPQPMLKANNVVSDQPALVYSLNEKYILVVRLLHIPKDHSFHIWHPEREIAFFTKDSEVEDTSLLDGV